MSLLSHYWDSFTSKWLFGLLEEKFIYFFFIIMSFFSYDSFQFLRAQIIGEEHNFDILILSFPFCGF